METRKDYPANNARIDEEIKTRALKFNPKSAKEMDVNIKSEGGVCVEIRDVKGIDRRKVLFVAEEQPMDLTFSQRLVSDEQVSESSVISLQSKTCNNVSDSKIYDEAKTNASFAIAKIVQAERFYTNVNVPKKRGRKRKASIVVPPLYDNPEYVHTVDSRQAEVLMAAKSLFSKRTRTLYHWMYPNTPKAHLKSAVSMSWETLGVQEKEFYISQVLGRFGFPQSSLMINPQLGGLRGLSVLPPIDLSSPSQLNSETHRAVSTILEGPKDGPSETTSWGQYGGSNFSAAHSRRVSRKRGRLGRPPGSKNQKHLKELDVAARPVTVENVGEDFQDDPELRQEFEQFKWALHMNK